MRIDFHARRLRQRKFGGKTAITLIGACLLACVPVHGPELMAAQGNVQFGVNLTTNNSCVVVVQSGGTLTTNANGTQLSSKNAGGQAGIADVYSISRYRISVDAPPFFLVSPPGGNDNVTFSATFSGRSLYRGRNFNERSGTRSVRLRRGYSVTRVTANVVADRTQAFPAGTYQTVAILRCE